jgi:hypothetical protein
MAVILSGVSTSQSEVLTESKDPLLFRTKMNMKGILILAARVELPQAPLLILGYMGSFDFVESFASE